MSNDKTLATADASYTTGHCAHNNQPGGCQLHNLQCGWPACDRRPAKPSLATVKHGGCVQLGDGLLPCPFCGGRAERIDLGPGSGDNEGGSCVACTGCQSSGPVEFGYKENFISDWNRRALSAQPSPGGQDASFPWENFPAYLIDKCEGDTISEEGLQQALAAMAKDGRYCIAARQPVCATVKDSLTVGGGQAVGEPVVFQIREVVRGDEDEWFKPTVERRQTWREIPKAHYDVYVSVMGGCGPMGVIGEPLGRVALEVNPYGPRMEVRALYAAPPAQAVDLGAAIKASFPLLTDYGLHHSNCCEYKLIDERHRLHNLLDSHTAGGQS